MRGAAWCVPNVLRGCSCLAQHRRMSPSTRASPEGRAPDAGRVGKDAQLPRVIDVALRFVA